EIAGAAFAPAVPLPEPPQSELRGLLMAIVCKALLPNALRNRKLSQKMQRERWHALAEGRPDHGARALISQRLLRDGELASRQPASPGLTWAAWPSGAVPAGASFTADCLRPKQL